MIISFLFAYAIGIGPVGWVYVAEISNLNGTLISSSTFWIGNVMLGALFPIASAPDALDIHGVFWIFGLINIIGFFFVMFYAPETKGMDRREISKML